MTTYAIGDIQGCYDPFRRLLDKLAFDATNDTLWIAGDLINRGPQSYQTVQFLRSLGAAAICILGNHDLHFLAVAAGALDSKPSDTFNDILEAPDRDAICQWLRHLPLVHCDPELNFTMIHAGLIPQWNSAQALVHSREIETVLRSDVNTEFFANMYGNGPILWRDSLSGWDRLRFITNALTRLRYCTDEGEIDLAFSGSPGSQPNHLLPWFDIPTRASTGERIVFGHWASLALEPAQALAHGTFHIDTGCVWGGKLTALNLETLRYVCEPAHEGDNAPRAV
jgi:bis(5'-nucleosyl)-tetraphosphatase (symmetrical)